MASGLTGHQRLADRDDDDDDNNDDSDLGNDAFLSAKDDARVALQAGWSMMGRSDSGLTSP